MMYAYNTLKTYKYVTTMSGAMEKPRPTKLAIIQKKEP
jgi:hypothetical protein